MNQSKLLPLKYMKNLTIELELVNDKDDPIVTPGVNAVFTAAKTSNDWQIENVQLKCDIVTLDNSLQNNYDSHLLSGKSLPINFNTYITQSQAITGQDVSVNVSRAISRLKSIFVSFYKTQTKDSGGTIVPDAISDVTHKEWLNFYHPMTNSSVYNKGYEIEAQIQVGSKNFPEYPLRSNSEMYAQLKKSVGILGSNFHSMSVTPAQYRNEHFVIGIDTEKALGASWTGLNTKHGDLLSIRLKAQDKATLTSALMPEQMFIILHADSVCSISDGGVEVWD
jgi:hypothetical protein